VSGPREINFAELLALLDYRDGDTYEHIAVCYSGGSLSFASSVMLPIDAPAFVVWQTGTGHHKRAPIAGGVDFNFWFSVNSIAGPARSQAGRGRSSSVVRWTALYADIDVKPEYCPDLATADSIVAEVAEVLGERPTAVIYSGHGLQPIWAINRESVTRFSNDAAERLLHWFGEVVKAVAISHGCKADPVFDLARVLRVPNTLNCKDPDAKVPVRCVLDDGRPMTVDQIAAALADSGIAERKTRRAAGSASYTNHNLRRQWGNQWGKRYTRKCLTERVRQAAKGRRNITLFGAAKDAARQGDGDEQMRAALTDAADAAGLDYDEIGPTIESGFQRGEDDQDDAPTPAPTRVQWGVEGRL
jgi:hypothetical protein